MTEPCSVCRKTFFIKKNDILLGYAVGADPCVRPICVSYLTISAMETWDFLSRAHTRVRPYDYVKCCPEQIALGLFLQSVQGSVFEVVVQIFNLGNNTHAKLTEPCFFYADL